MKNKLFTLSILFLVGLWFTPVMGMELVRQRGVATIISFPIVDSDGAVVVDEDDAGTDSETDNWADGTAPDGFTDCTNEAVETDDGVSGWYYLSLTAAEMTYDYISVRIITTTAGVVDQRILIRTIVGDPLKAATTDDSHEFSNLGG